MNEVNASVKVNNVSRDPERYMVARLVDGELWFYGSWDDIDKAYEVANGFENGLVLTRIGE